MQIRSRRSAGPHAIRNRVVAFLLAFVQKTTTCATKGIRPDFLQTGISTQVCTVCMYAQVPQHVAISLIFRTTVDNKKISVEVLPIGLCIYRIFLSCPSTCGFGLQVSFACLSLGSLEVGTQSTQSQVVGLGCSTGLGNVTYLLERLTRFSSFDTRHTYLPRQVRISLL